jgi:hypothetical protein
MLAQSFQSAADLGITEPQLSALIKTLVLLETGKLVHVPRWSWSGDHSNEFTSHFNMAAWGSKTDCGTIHCIGGTAEAVSGDENLFAGWTDHGKLSELFAPYSLDFLAWEEVTTAQAATALRSYLTTGDARWDQAVAS